MNLKQTLDLQAGGPGSGRYPKGSGTKEWYHGTSGAFVDQIRKEGLLNNSTSYKVVFASSNKVTAMGYAFGTESKRVDNETTKVKTSALVVIDASKVNFDLSDWMHDPEISMSSKPIPASAIKRIEIYDAKEQFKKGSAGVKPIRVIKMNAASSALMYVVVNLK